jgi:hypothetical protein
MSKIYRERLPLSPAGDEREALGLDGHPCPLNVLFNIPKKKKLKFSININLYGKQSSLKMIYILL